MMARRKRLWAVSALIVQSLLLILAMPAPVPASTAEAVMTVDVFWNAPRLMSTTSDDGAFLPVLKSDTSGRLMLMYNQVTEQGIEIPYYRESLDGGETWLGPETAQESETALLQATFDFDKDALAHAVWRTQNGIWHSREDQWPGSANPITSTTQLVFSPDIAAAPDDRLHVVWAQQDNRIYHAYSEDGGSNWFQSPAIAGDQNKSDEPAISSDQNGNVHVVWEERIYDPGAGNFRYEVHYLPGVSSEIGVSWASTPTVLSAGVDNARRPAIVAGSEAIHVSFASRLSDEAQYAYYIQHTAGAGWSVPMDVTRGNPLSVNSNIPFVLVPVLAVCGDTPYVYFHGAHDTNGKEAILGVSSSTGWNSRDYVEAGNARAIRPSVVCADSKIHIVYEEIIQPNVDHQIYYTYGLRHSLHLPVITKLSATFE